MKKKDKAQAVRVRELPPPPLIDEEDPDAELLRRTPEPIGDDEEKLSDFLEQFGGKEYKVRVEQFNKEDKVWEHIDTFAVDGFDAFDVCKRIGRGRYRMTFLNERGKYVPGGQPQIRIGGPVTPLATQAQAAPEASDPLKHPLVVMMLASAEAARKENSELIRAILTKPEPAKSTTNEVLEMIVKLKALEPKNDDGNKKMFDAVLGTLIERALNPDKPEAAGGGLMSEAREGLALLKESGVLERLSTRRPPAAPVSRVLANPAPAPETPLMESPLISAMRPYVAVFRMKAENAVAVDVAADYLLDEVYETLVPLIKKHVTGASLVSDETIVENIVNRAEDPAQVDEVFKFAPELEPHRAWVVAVISKTIETVKTPVEEVPANG